MLRQMGRNSIISNRISHLLNLRAPSMSIDTTCSSSLCALHLAVTALCNSDCDAAIVGGSNLLLSLDIQQVPARYRPRQCAMHSMLLRMATVELKGLAHCI